MKRKKELRQRKKRSVRAAVRWRVYLTGFLIWLLLAAALVVTTAERFYDRLYELANASGDNNIRYALSWVSEYYDPDSIRYDLRETRPEQYADTIRSVVGTCCPESIRSLERFGWDGYSTGIWQYSLLSDVSIPIETACVFFDGEGNWIAGNDRPVLYFSYETEEEWDNLVPAGGHKGWIDLSEGLDAEDTAEDPFAGFRPKDQEALLKLRSYFGIWKITGRQDGDRIVPYRIERSVKTTWEVMDVSDKKIVEWETVTDRLDRYDGNVPLVTIYVHDFYGWLSPSKPVRYEGKTYDSVAALAVSEEIRQKLKPTATGSEISTAYNMGRKTLGEMLTFCVRSFGTDSPDVTMIYIVHASPLLAALKALMRLFGWSLLLTFAALRVLERSLEKQLVKPVSDVTQLMADKWMPASYDNEDLTGWRETDTLLEEYDKEAMRRWRTDEELTRTKKALDYASEAETRRREMLSMMAHELKTPLAVVHSYAEGLQEHIAEEKREQYLATILAETEKMDGIVLEMLDYSRLEAGKVKLSRDEFDFNALAKARLERLRPFAEEKQLTVTEEFPGELKIAADEARVTQALDNLIGNAVRYTPEGGSIFVKVTRAGDKARFRVENSGRNFTKEELGRVFETFYRADTSGNTRGTGLGLAIVKQIAELHGGSCWAENVGDGVAFTVEFPV